ncbi:glycoside hydrolase family 30 protein [Sphingobacterium siyangense]|uniref:glycoside hydrolase family 30 protein n=1 Tax=Sphingobacterium siyangense TaxID=459529 RepID=UPI0028B1D3BD|nr:glycoside hydrolase family 30 beta sandwich domain-containing protein [Sphingobacterium siyangense]
MKQRNCRLLSLLISCLCYSFVQASPGRAKDQVELYVTTQDKKQDLKNIRINARVQKDVATTIVLDPQVRFQQMDGFGAAITGSTCYNLMQMQKKDRQRFLNETFNPKKGFGHSYIRISIGCSDFSLSEYTCCDEEGLEHFALQNEEVHYVLPVLKEILKINPDIKILGSPWTSPRWMKVNNLVDLLPFNSWTSGQLNPRYYTDYAKYFVKWIRAFEENGVKIYAITPQNEPLNRKNSASLFMGWMEQRDFVKSLGAEIASAGLQTKIYAFDHNYNYDNMKDQQGYPLHIYADTLSSKYLAGAAYHNYGGKREELLRIHAARPDKGLLFTETSIGTWNKGQDFALRLIEDMEEVGLGTVNNWCSGVMVWNLMLDSDRGPWREGGCKTCYGAVDIDRKNYKSISRNSHYYVISHLSAVVKPGATRIGTKAVAADGLIHAGFQNSDGTMALVLLNKTAMEKIITISDQRTQFTYTVPPKSVVSYRWD